MITMQKASSTARLAGRIDFKKYCVISVWFGCNNHCGICMLSDVKSSLPPVGFDRYRTVISDIMRAGRFENLILSGAEVTTFDDLDKYVACAASLGWFKKIQIQTNGRRLSESPYLKHLIDCGVNEFFVSVHGFAETHNRAAGVQGAFEQVHAGLRNLSDYNVNVISNTVLTKDNLPEIAGLVRFLCGECINEIHLWNYFPMDGEDGKDLLVRFTDLQRLLPELKETMRAAGKVMVLKSFPLCLFTGAPVFFDSVFPETVLPDLFWKEFAKCGFGKCIYRDNGACNAVECWGLSSAYLNKYGDERTILNPMTLSSAAEPAPVENIQRRTATEFEGDHESFYDFCLWEYQPAAPFAGKMKSANLLFHSFDVAGADPRCYDLVDAIRASIGHSRTVWGIKRLGQSMQWEFYFYDYARRNRVTSISRVLEVISPFIASPLKANERFPYFMFSFDVFNDLLTRNRDLNEVHMYIGNPGSTVSSGVSYLMTPHADMRLENFYFFFDAKKQMGEILSKAACSAFIDSRVSLDYIIWPEMRNCKVIVVANKQQNDAVYFSGINVDQFILFLKRMRYPVALVSFIEQNKSALDHLQYDAGFDYRVEGDQLVILKSGYYGIF